MNQYRCGCPCGMKCVLVVATEDTPNFCPYAWFTPLWEKEKIREVEG